MIRELEFVEDSDRAWRYGVTLTAIRGDPKILSEQSLSRQEHGGSSLVNLLDRSAEPGYATTVLVNHGGKVTMGFGPAAMALDGDSIVLDPSTTNLECFEWQEISCITATPCSQTLGWRV